MILTCVLITTYVGSVLIARKLAQNDGYYIGWPDLFFVLCPIINTAAIIFSFSEQIGEFFDKIARWFIGKKQ